MAFFQYTAIIALAPLPYPRIFPSSAFLAALAVVLPTSSTFAPTKFFAQFPELGMKTVPCIIADDLSDEQIRAFRLADNKVSELADWDFKLLDIELGEITGIDMTDFGFELPDDDEYYGDERERTYNSVNLHDYDNTRVAGAYDMPVIQATNHVPKDLISFNYMLTKDDFAKGIHFYIDDYQFERIWNTPDKYMDRLAMFDCVLTPDFSLYMDMPLAMQIWNVYRSRLIGQKMQDSGNNGNSYALMVR